MGWARRCWGGGVDVDGVFVDGDGGELCLLVPGWWIMHGEEGAKMERRMISTLILTRFNVIECILSTCP